MDDDTNMDLTYTESMRLICAFKKHGILWNPHVRGYHNRETKEEAWKIIAAESSIHPEVCKRKMKSLVSSCRREKIKIIKSRSSGKPEDIYDPKWRYWNAFKFLRGLEDDDEDPLGTAPEQDILDPTMTPSWLKSRMVGKRKKTPPKPIPDPLAAAQQTVTPSNGDENNSIGVTVASKLRKMYHDQRLFAENLINQALFKGMMFQLCRQSEIKTPPQKPSSTETSGLNDSPVTCIEVSSSSQSSPPPPVLESSVDKDEVIQQFQCTESNVTPCEILPRAVKSCDILPCVVEPCEILPRVDQSFEILESPCLTMSSRHTLPSLPPISHLVMDNRLLDSGSLSPDDSSDYKELTIL